jgi:hypothetical protein
MKLHSGIARRKGAGADGDSNSTDASAGATGDATGRAAAAAAARLGVGVGSVVGEMDTQTRVDALDGDYDARNDGADHDLGHAALHEPLPLPVWVTVMVLAVIGAKDPGTISRATANTLLGLLLRLLRENQGVYTALIHCTHYTLHSLYTALTIHCTHYTKVCTLPSYTHYTLTIHSLYQGVYTALIHCTHYTLTHYTKVCTLPSYTALSTHCTHYSKVFTLPSYNPYKLTLHSLYQGVYTALASEMLGKGMQQASLLPTHLLRADVDYLFGLALGTLATPGTNGDGDGDDSASAHNRRASAPLSVSAPSSASSRRGSSLKRCHVVPMVFND